MLICVCIVCGFHVQRQKWEVATETVQSAKPKIFILYYLYYLRITFTENVCQVFQATSATPLSLCWAVRLAPPWSFLCTSHPRGPPVFPMLTLTTQNTLLKKAVNYVRVRRALLIYYSESKHTSWDMADTPIIQKWPTVWRSPTWTRRGHVGLLHLGKSRSFFKGTFHLSIPPERSCNGMALRVSAGEHQRRTEF